MDETQHRLVSWTEGQESERLAAQILADQGYQDIDPSHPYGGKDGGRDIICSRDGKPWIGAVYFPRGQKSISEITSKLASDLKSAREHNPHGLAFVTNQEVKLAERDALNKLADDIEIDIFHMERVAFVLNQPHMHSLRKQYLDIDTGPVPLDIHLSIDGAAHYFVDGNELRDGLIEKEVQRIREAAAKSRAISPAERAKLDMIAKAMNRGELGDPPSEEDTEKTVAALRERVERNWPRSEEWLGTRGWDGLRFTVTNNAESFLTRVELVITFHGVKGFETDYLHNPNHIFRYLLNPDWEPTDWHDGMATPMSIPRLANQEVQWENDGGDLTVTIGLEELRPQPAAWRSNPDEVIVMVPRTDTPIEVTWFATAHGHGTAFRGEPIALPVDAASFRDALGRLINGEDADA
ncbi:hypothetical protein [Prescottella sp. R16]|uniref:hypothetical protein n=1 Tax=Prescottella sp. R16 TaxID=3064529 RepID=UPI00272E188A|nr:hypothetical protein [Prescottella sp. R16]